MKLIIRNETPADCKEVENLVRDSFWNVYRPGCTEHFVLHTIRKSPYFIPELSFVMELNGEIIGQNIFVNASVLSDNGEIIPITTMGPICIANKFKRLGYGKKLLDYSLEKAAAFGCSAVCFEGNINFYGKSGFTYAENYGLRYHNLPKGADSSFFLCKELKVGYLRGITGEYEPPECYRVNEAAFEEFDKAFPQKEKLKLPGQLF